MTPAAMARRDVMSSLRQTIAKIEGRLVCRLEQGAAPPQDAMRVPDGVVARRGVESIDVTAGSLATGAAGFDRALGGGLPLGALTEIIAAETRDAGSAAGFALALCARLPACIAGPVLWVGTEETFHEAGLPYAMGISSLYGIAPGRLMVAHARRAGDALWIAGEAAGLPDLAAVVLELRGAPKALDLTATRRLHRRAHVCGRPVLLLRLAGVAQPTAAEVRLTVGPAPAAPRRTVAGPLAGSIGPPAFRVAIDKSRQAPAQGFILEWNSHDLCFRESASGRELSIPEPAPGAGAVAAEPSRSTHHAPAAGAVLAFAGTAGRTARGEPAGEQRKAHRRARSAG